jgi:hypothetical protein
LFTGHHPFHGLNHYAVALHVVSGRRPIRPTAEDGRCRMTNDMWQFIQDAWLQDPSTRPPMLQLRERLHSIHITSIPNQQRSSTASGHLRALVDISIPQAIGSQDDPSTSFGTHLSFVSAVPDVVTSTHCVTRAEIASKCTALPDERYTKSSVALVSRSSGSLKTDINIHPNEQRE